MTVGSAVIEVEVVRAEPGRAVIGTYCVPRGTCVDELLRLAAADPVFAGIDMCAAVVGVHGRVAQRQQVLEDGDRLELYRPLAADPKQARRARAKAARLPRR